MGERENLTRVKIHTFYTFATQVAQNRSVKCIP